MQTLEALQCEKCGSLGLKKIGQNLFECEHCNCKYIENAGKMIMIMGDVKGSDFRQRKLRNAIYFTEQGKFTEARKTFDELLYEYPADKEVNEAYYSMIIKGAFSDLEKYGIKLWQDKNSSKAYFDLIGKAKEYGINTTELKKQIYDYCIKSSFYDAFKGIMPGLYTCDIKELDNYHFLKLLVVRYKLECLYSRRNPITSKAELIKENIEMIKKEKGDALHLRAKTLRLKIIVGVSSFLLGLIAYLFNLWDMRLMGAGFLGSLGLVFIIYFIIGVADVWDYLEAKQNFKKGKISEISLQLSELNTIQTSLNEINIEIEEKEEILQQLKKQINTS